MAITKCPDCNGTLFQMMERPVSGARFRYNFIQCSSCGSAITAVDFANAPFEIENASRKITNLEKEVRDLQQKVNYLVDGMERVLRSMR